MATQNEVSISPESVWGLIFLVFLLFVLFAVYFELRYKDGIDSQRYYLYQISEVLLNRGFNTDDNILVEINESLKDLKYLAVMNNTVFKNDDTGRGWDFDEVCKRMKLDKARILEMRE